MSRNFGLDVIRSFSIWLVLLQHGGINIHGLSPLKIGLIGVEFFFVLSGFLIGDILFKEIGKNKSVGSTLSTFWTRRWFRIIPLYYLVILVKFIVFDHSIGWKVLYYLFFLQNDFEGTYFYPVTWSLVIEEWFYLFAPCFLICLDRLFQGNSVKIFYALILFLIFENAARFLYVYTFDAPYLAVTCTFWLRFDSPFMGVFLAFLRNNNASIYQKLESGIAFVLGMISLVLYLFSYFRWAFPINYIDELMFPRTIGFFMVSLSIALMIPYVAKFRFFPATTFQRRIVYVFFTQTSLLTYAIYFIHPIIFPLVLNESQSVVNNHMRLLGLPMAVILTYGVAFALYKLYEKPFLILRDRVTASASVRGLV